MRPSGARIQLPTTMATTTSTSRLANACKPGISANTANAAASSNACLIRPNHSNSSIAATTA